MTLSRRLLVFALLAASLSACQSRLVNVSHHPLRVDSDPTLAEAEAAIRAGATRRGWAIEPGVPGVLVGTFRLREHLAVVEIQHDATHFDVDYRASENLAEHGDGYIHHNYNRWLDDLVFEISGRRLAKPRK